MQVKPIPRVTRSKRKRSARAARCFARAVDALLMTIFCTRRIAAKHPRISADPLTKPKRELREIAAIAKAR
jgi:hypothetical protein